jgi:hypothetical protein
MNSLNKLKKRAVFFNNKNSEARYILTETRNELRTKVAKANLELSLPGFHELPYIKIFLKGHMSFYFDLLTSVILILVEPLQLNS